RMSFKNQFFFPIFCTNLQVKNLTSNRTMLSPYTELACFYFAPSFRHLRMPASSRGSGKGTPLQRKRKGEKQKCEKLNIEPLRHL
ncbi:MAG: hypothetical protein RSB11_08010, partial [Oscillospiraceae bacterium]